MNEIRMIPTEQLHHHPENPRKGLGDLTELADSIRTNGIMQNLTVIRGHMMSMDEYVAMARAEGVDKVAAIGTYTPENAWTAEGYTVVIGNRRMEAAKAAGLAEVPCAVSDMDHRTQISTMLMENMQRADLTVYEQAQGFQMMMDLGFSPKEIGEKTGFSEKTVRDRIKFTKFNQKNFESAVKNGATLIDMLEISKLESKADQNDAMKAVGTNNFRQVLNRKLGDQKYGKNCERLGKIAQEEGIREIPDGEIVWRNFDSQGTPTGTYENEDKIRKAIRKAVKANDGKQVFYQFGRGWDSDDAKLELYTRKEIEAKEPSEEEKAQRERERARQKKLREVKKMWAEAYQLRTSFIREYSVNVNGTGMSMIGKVIIRYALSQQEAWGKKPLPARHDWQEKYIRDVLGIKQEEYEDSRSIWEIVEEKGIPVIRAALAWFCGGGVLDCDTPESGSYYYYDGSFRENRGIVKRYDFLKEVGYEMSDMEIQLMDGTHPIYQV